MNTGGIGLAARTHSDVVEIMKVGTKRPPRVLVRFVDEEFEGRQEWVPSTRLKVSWDGVEQWLEAERRWLAVVEASAPAVKTLEHRAADTVAEKLQLMRLQLGPPAHSLHLPLRGTANDAGGRIWALHPADDGRRLGRAA